MKTKYRFKIYGDLKPDVTFPVEVLGLSLEFVLEEGNIVALDILENTDLKELPKFIQGPNAVHTLNMGNATPEKFKKSLKLAEGLLSVFGLREIVTDTVEIEWIPDNEEEQKLLQISSFTYKVEPQEIDEAISFDLIARPFIAGFLNDKYEVALSFFCQGKNDMRDGKYIEAYYDFYFVLEALYGSGKTKNSAIEIELMNNSFLVKSIEEVKGSSEVLAGIKSEHRSEFLSSYKDKDINDIIKEIVKKRGFLHHQNPKHPSAWTPDRQESVHVDSLFMMHLTFKIVWSIVDRYIYDDAVLRSYSAQYVKHGHA
ncbi:MAG: hypothetical protein ACI8Q1_003663 [Parvicella sp.]|jgi:hypothetical protein